MRGCAFRLCLLLPSPLLAKLWHDARLGCRCIRCLRERRRRVELRLQSHLPLFHQLPLSFNRCKLSAGHDLEIVILLEPIVIFIMHHAILGSLGERDLPEIACSCSCVGSHRFSTLL